MSSRLWLNIDFRAIPARNLRRFEMKQGRTLTELAAEIERQAAAKRDFVVDSREMSMIASSDHTGREGEPRGSPFS
jgi:hypothetical protein